MKKKLMNNFHRSLKKIQICNLNKIQLFNNQFKIDNQDKVNNKLLI